MPPMAPHLNARLDLRFSRQEIADGIIMKEWLAIGFKWRVLRHRFRGWYYLERDGIVIEEGGDYRKLLTNGWYN
jgi:hypothetical protein